MLRIQELDSGDLVTLVLSGWTQKADMGVLKGLMEKHNKAVVLDLEGVKLVDRDAVRFLASFETGQAKITNCPRYIREWIRRERPECGITAMHSARSFLTILFLVGSLAGVTPVIAAEDTSPPPTTSYEVKVLAQVAAVLAAGIRAMRDLDGPPIENSDLDRLNVPTPGMDCGIDRSLVFVVCRGASLPREEAEAMFARMMDYGQVALSSGDWRQVEQVPRAGLIRSISYQHLRSGAHIDLDLVVYRTGEAEPLYSVRFFGFPRF